MVIMDYSTGSNYLGWVWPHVVIYHTMRDYPSFSCPVWVLGAIAVDLQHCKGRLTKPRYTSGLIPQQGIHFFTKMSKFAGNWKFVSRKNNEKILDLFGLYLLSLQYIPNVLWIFFDLEINFHIMSSQIT